MTQVNNNTPAVNSATSSNQARNNPDALLFNMVQNSDTVSSSSEVQGVNNERSASQGTQIELMIPEQERELNTLKFYESQRQLTESEQKRLDELNKLAADNTKLAQDNPEHYLDLVVNAILSGDITELYAPTDNMSIALGKLLGTEQPVNPYYGIRLFQYLSKYNGTSDLNHDGKVDHKDFMFGY